MSIPRYPGYKDSGVEWLGEVPSHWGVARFKLSVESCQNGIWGDEPAGNSNDLPCVRVADFDRTRLRVVLDEPTLRNIKPNEQKGRLLTRGNLVLEKSGGGEKQPVGFVVLYDDERDAVCSNFTAKIELSAGMNPSFWRYVHAAAYSIRLNVPSIKQTSGIQNLDQKSYLDERAAYPSSDEQIKIAGYLDQETARIDALVDEQKRLIELLNEKRQAMISQAVTKGLDRDTPMKDSGVEWIGEVPAHWDIQPLKRYLNFLTSGSRGWAKHYSDDGELFIRIGNLRRESIDLDLSSKQYVQVPNDAESKRAAAHPGDLLFSITAYLGSVAVVPDDIGSAYVSQHVALARTDSSYMSSRWVAFVTLSDIGKNYLSAQGYGGTKVQLALDDVAGLILPVPPRNEQTEILAFITKGNRKLDSLIAEAERTVKLLRERRAALISAAVTGKIDVRDWKAPADAEPEPYDIAAEPDAAHEVSPS